MSSWFLGPKAENRDILNRLALHVLHRHAESRDAYFPTDPSFVDEKMKSSAGFKAGVEKLESQLNIMSEKFINSVPTFSSRYRVSFTPIDVNYLRPCTGIIVTNF